MGDREEIEELRGEVARLAAENDELRSRFRVGPPDPAGSPEEEVCGIAVFLTPDPAGEPRPGGPGPEAIANLARTLVGIMAERRPDLDWRAEHDLARIPRGAACYRLGEAIARLMGGKGLPPKTFRVDRDEKGEPRLRRLLIDGEPDSDRFRQGSIAWAASSTRSPPKARPRSERGPSTTPVGR